MADSNAPESALEHTNETAPMTSENLAADQASREAPVAGMAVSGRRQDGLKVTPPPDDFGFSSPPASSPMFSPFVPVFSIADGCVCMCVHCDVGWTELRRGDEHLTCLQLT